MLVSECEGLSFPQLPHEDEGRTLKVIPLFRHLVDEEEKEIKTKLRSTSEEDESVHPHHLQQVLLQRFHSGERFHLQHAACPVDQSCLARRSLQAEPQPPRQDLMTTNRHA